MENKTFLQYQFYISRRFEDTLTTLTTPPLEVYLHIYFKTQTHSLS